METSYELHASAPLYPGPFRNLIRGCMGRRDGVDVLPLPPALQQNKSLCLSIVKGSRRRIAVEILILNEGDWFVKKGK